MLVSDIGPLDAKIMLVGEAPGQTEEQTGQPFVGSSGKLLKQMLSHSGINYNECYVTNVSPERPPGNDFTHYYEDKKRKEATQQLLEWRQIVRDKVEKIKPNVVIALGAEALRALTNKRSVDAWRGCILTYRDIKIIPTYHPAGVMRNYSWHPIAEMDMAKASRESMFSEVKEDPYYILTKPTLQQTISWLARCKHSMRVSWDIETVGKHIRCIGLAAGGPKCPDAIVIPFIKFPSTDMVMPGEKNIISIGNVSESMSSYWNKHDELLVLRSLARIMETKSIPKVGHNSLCFDAPILLNEFKMEVNNHCMDTMHAFHLLYSEMRMGLKFLNTIMLNYHNYWSGKDTGNDKSEWEYCGMDAISTLVLSYKLTDELNNAGMMKLYKHINNLGIALARVQERGVNIDNKARKNMIVDKKLLLKNILKQIEAVAGVGFNPNSPKQVKELIYDKLKFPAMYKNKSLTSDEASIKKLMRRYPNETVLRDIITYRKTSKLINTFLEMKFDEDGKMRTSYNASGTKSGRLSSSKTLWGTGMNLQNIPVGKSKGVENIRNLFIPSKGKLWLKADLKQAESSVVAEILFRHGDPTLRDLHKSKYFDEHNWFGSKIFDKSEDSITKHERDIAKIGNHSGNYGAGPGVLVNLAAKEEIDINYNMAKQILAARFKAIPGLRKWWRAVELQLRKTRTITTCMGRRRIFFGRLDDATFRDAYSFEPQSIVGDVTNQILTEIELNPSSKLDLLLQVHDEIDGELEGDLDEVVNEIQRAAEIPLYINEIPLIIPIDIEVGNNWRDVVNYKEYNNGSISNRV